MTLDGLQHGKGRGLATVIPFGRAVKIPLLTRLSLQLADVVDNEAMQVYMKPSSHEESKAPSKGFVVRDAPWATVNNEKVSAASATSLGAQGTLCQGLTLRSVPPISAGDTEHLPSCGDRESSEGPSCSLWSVQAESRPELCLSIS